ncbi:MAG TPA: hypothetical protein VI122_22170 [Thermoleophilaceae bacterium]
MATGDRLDPYAIEIDGDTIVGAPGTKWSAANAIAEYADYGRRYTKRSNQVQGSFEATRLKRRGPDHVLSG